MFPGDDMLSNRYQLSIIAAVFFALGIGILLGGTLGGQWLNNRQQALLTHLEKRFSEEHLGRQKLEVEVAKLRKDIIKEKEQSKLLTQQLIKDQLENRSILLVGGDHRLQQSVEEAISWAGGQATRYHPNRSIPETFDAVIFLADTTKDFQQKAKVLNDLHLVYHAPVIVQTSVQEVSWQQEFHSNTYSYFGELSNPLDSVKLIQTVRRAIINEKEPEYAYH